MYMKDYEINKKILAFFNNGENQYISGEEISSALGVSRANIWKYISRLRDDGYVIDAVPHLGYRLSKVPDKLFSYEIDSALKTKRLGKKNIYHFESIKSTNDKAYSLAEEGAQEGVIVVAETQTKGKGRVGRSWESPRGGIYFSLVLKPDLETDEIPTITLVAALSMVKAIKKTAKLEALIKWPNDIIAGGKKICGILTEIKAQPDKVDFLVLGIGVNVNVSKEKLPEVGGSIDELSGNKVRRADLIKTFLEFFEKDYFLLNKNGFKALRDDCKKNSLVLGKKVKIEERHKKIEGLAEDIDEKGALILRTKDGKRQRVFSGDVLLCR